MVRFHCVHMSDNDLFSEKIRIQFPSYVKKNWD